MELNDLKVPFESMMLANIRDYLAYIWWSKTEDGQKNRNRPELIAPKLSNNSIKNEEVVGFNSSEEFEKKRREILGGTNGN